MVPSVPAAPKRQRAPRPPANYGEADIGYGEYLRLNDLLALQVPLSKPPHHDELLFITIHQAYELWFKLLLHELETVRALLKNGNEHEADHFARRAVKVTQLLVQQIHLLETMRPADFLKFRDHLKPASGFQSVQFREIEFLVGLKEPAYLNFFRDRPELTRRLQARLDEPSLGDALVGLLRRRGFDVPAGAATANGDGEAHDRYLAAVVKLYENPSSHPQTYALLETLLDLDQSLSLWREHHVRVVERIIGQKRGTGGSSGVAYLRTTTPKQAFPVLWEARSHLGGPSA